eukprot:TRINITY_DN23204_c0_g1_i1.p1 TRINITY_DN23204_c0_g1~~TRINITY_DN23204_c0_g1_i1.p1  ORF type:complete len:249 (-),score=53.45 TRINITY_DN23204_c0_g1_i1:42-716(-)
MAAILPGTPPTAEIGDFTEVQPLDIMCKVLVVGHSGSGKTSLIQRSVFNVFSHSYQATIGVDFTLKKIVWNSHTHVRLQLWDISGQERFAYMTRAYYRDAVGAFVVFDLTSRESLDAALKWKTDIESKVPMSTSKRIPIILLANKCDLPSQQHVVTSAQLEALAHENNFVTWFITSAKANVGIDEALRGLVALILADSMVEAEPAESPTFVVPPSPQKQEFKCC